MRTHITLEVEVGKLITSTELKKLRKVAIRVDLTTVALILEIVLTDIGINLASYLSASHLGTSRATKERGKLIRDKCGLYETARGTVSGLTTTARRSLVGNLKLASSTALKLANSVFRDERTVVTC